MSQALSVSELFPIIFNYFPSNIEHFKKYFPAALKVLLPYILVSFGFGLLTVLVSMLTNSMESSTAMVVGGILALIMGLISLLLIPFAFYFGFCQFRLVINSHKQTPETLSESNLWAFDESFWGYLGLSCLLALIAFPLSIAICIGLILFILPGLAIAGLYGAFCNATLFSYFENPSAGIGAALTKGVEIIKVDWVRWLILFLIVSIAIIIAYIVLLIPVGILSAILPTTLAQGITQIVPCIFTFVGLYFTYVSYQCYKDVLANVPQQQAT